jgi:hypothetical protein
VLGHDPLMMLVVCLAARGRALAGSDRGHRGPSDTESKSAIKM